MGKTRLVPYLVEVNTDDGHSFVVIWDDVYLGRPNKTKLMDWLQFNPNNEVNKRVVISAHAFSQRTMNIIVSYERSQKEAIEDEKRNTYEISYTADFHANGWKPYNGIVYKRAYNENEALEAVKARHMRRPTNTTYTYNSVKLYCMFEII
jgi:hypothetical protein